VAGHRRMKRMLMPATPANTRSDAPSTSPFTDIEARQASESSIYQAPRRWFRGGHDVWSWAWTIYPLNHFRVDSRFQQATQRLECFLDGDSSPNDLELHAGSGRRTGVDDQRTPSRGDGGDFNG